MFSKIHECCIVGREEFGLVLWITMQFGTDGSPLCVQPWLQTCKSNEISGLNEARKWKIWQSCTTLSACDAKIERRAGDSQMDVGDGQRAILEKFVEQPFEEDKRINCAFLDATRSPLPEVWMYTGYG